MEAADRAGEEQMSLVEDLTVLAVAAGSLVERDP